MLFELEELEELEAVEVPLVVLWSDWTRADRLASVEKAAVTELPFLQSDVRVPDPETKLTVAHFIWRCHVSCCVPEGVGCPRFWGVKSRTWYNSPSGALATRPKTPFWPTQLSGAATASTQ